MSPRWTYGIRNFYALKNFVRIILFESVKLGKYNKQKYAALFSPFICL